MLFPIEGETIKIAPKDLAFMFDGCAELGKHVLGKQLSAAYVDLLQSMKLRANAFTDEQFEEVETAIGSKHSIRFPFTEGVIDELGEVYNVGSSIAAHKEDEVEMDEERMAGIEFLAQLEADYNVFRFPSPVSLEEAISRHPATVSKTGPPEQTPVS